MRDFNKMERPLSDDDREWLKANNYGKIAAQFDREDGVSDTGERDYTEMSVDDLKAEINRRNKEILAEDPEAEPMPVTGKKSELVARLKDDDAAVAGE